MPRVHVITGHGTSRAYLEALGIFKDQEHICGCQGGAIHRWANLCCISSNTVKDRNRRFIGEGWKAETIYSHLGNYEGQLTCSREILWWEQNLKRTARSSKGKRKGCKLWDRQYLGTAISFKYFLLYCDILWGWEVGLCTLRVENSLVQSAVEANNLLFSNSYWWRVKHFWF